MLGDNLDRTAKILVDRDGMSFANAASHIAATEFQVDVGESWVSTPGADVAVLTAVNCGIRAFGVVRVRLARDGAVELGLHRRQALSAAVATLGGTLVSEHSNEHPTLAFCNPSSPKGSILLFGAWEGWCGGVAVDQSVARTPLGNNPMSAILAAAIGVSECFQNVHQNPVAGRRTVGVSLWRPDIDWMLDAAIGPAVRYLPESAWLMGLGHLGQAYAWVLSSLPYPEDHGPAVYLQDIETMVTANVSTGVLSSAGDVGRLKTRVVSGKLEGIGFKTRLVERRIDDSFIRHTDEPGLAVSGFDNFAARRALGSAGFDRTVDAGLGSGFDNYLDVLVRSFGGSFDGRSIYQDPPSAREHVLGAGYELQVAEEMASGQSEADARCGLIDVAGKSVGASFVGVTSACLVWSEVIRLLHAGASYSSLGFNLDAPSRVSCASTLTEPGRLGFINAQG